jgi:hypothetical protein
MSYYPFQSVQDTDKPQEQIKLSYVPPPPRELNGGLYTGEPFLKGAPWANVPVIPDVDYMINVNLRSANPPTQALYQYPGNTRPGNNYQKNTGLQQYVGSRGFEAPYNFSCVACKTINIPKDDCKCRNISFISGNSFNDCICNKYNFIDV